jgi:pimeloyl-ACP methyl ester carboxylesterase
MPPVTSWDEALAQSQAVYGGALPGLSTERWRVLVRRAYRTSASGQPEPDADPMIGEAVRASNTATPDLWPAWAALGALPVLALRGELSDILTEATCAKMKAVKPDPVQVTVPGRGHAPLLDEPVALAAIDAFVAGLDPGAAIGQA